jgi:N-acetylmuramoyl-L-alanine amidase
VAPGIAAASVGSEFYLLSSPVLVHYGRAYVPREVATRARKTFGKPAVKPPVKPPKSLHYLQRVCLDPGHGGRDPGAGRNGVYEEDVVIPVAKLLGEELRRRGFDVVFTRTTDVAVELAERPAIAARAGADLFISIHANASANASVRGIEILYIDGAKYKTTERADQANRAGRRPGPEDVGEGVMLDAAANQAVLDMLFEEFRREGIEVAESLRLAFKAAGLTVRSVRAQNLNVLRNAEMPAVLVELGFLTNASERKLLTQRWYQEKLARTMADGILAYRKKLEQTRGFSN